MNRQTTLDMKQFLDDHFGGVQPLLEHHPWWTYEQVHKWRSRGSLPGPDLATLLHIIEDRDGGPISITKYIQGNPCTANLQAKPDTTGPTSDVFA